jgi:hypothetical protein
MQEPARLRKQRERSATRLHSLAGFRLQAWRSGEGLEVQVGAIANFAATIRKDVVSSLLLFLSNQKDHGSEFLFM